MSPKAEIRSPLRRSRLKRVFEGRRDRLHELQHGRPQAPQAVYSTAVWKYLRARIAWRAYRGWS